MSEDTSLERIHSEPPEVRSAVPVTAYPVDAYPADAPPSLLEYWRVLLKRRWTVLSFLLLVVTTVMIGTLKQRPVYQAKAVLQIDNEDPSILTFQDFVAEVNPGDESYLQTAINVLRSRSLAHRVIDRLSLDQNPEFQATPSWFGSLWGNESSQQAERNAGVSPLDSLPQDQIDIFLNRVAVEPVQGSRLVGVSFDSYDPELSARAVNTLASNFIDMNLEAKWDATQKASDWLSQQLVGLKATLEKSEEELQRYARENSILFLDERQSLTAQKLEQLQEELTKAEAGRIQKESLSDQVLLGNFDSVPGLLDHRLYQDLTLKLADLRREYSELSATFTPEYPRVKRLKSQMDEMEALLKQERDAFARRIADDYRAAINRERLLQQVLARQTEEFNQIAEKSIQYKILQREVETNKQLYEGLLQRLKEASISAGLRASNVRVVDPAEVPAIPARPRILLNLVLALIVGLGLGLGMAFFQEYLDNSLKTPDDVQRFLRLPTLGMIPAAKAAGRLAYGYGSAKRKRLPTPSGNGQTSDLNLELLTAEGNGLLGEAYRSLRTSLLLSSSGRPPRVVLITSGQPGEGKTTTLVNLGIALVHLGGRVVLIDSDMRRPRVSALLKLPAAAAGLSTYLTGQSAIDDVITPTAIANLFVIPCGPTPPNPAELLSSSLMTTLLEQVRQRFDYVLLDSPPVLHVSDARILATRVEAVILVVQGAATPRQAARLAKEQLHQVNANVIGVALNNLDVQANGYNYYYPYYQGYGTGYTNGDKPSDGASQHG
jgi:capsular exopolysaccharide synthesis family protein